MEKIQFDSGVQEFMLGSGVLRFNPSDPNLYGRFLEAGEKIADIQNNLAREAEQSQDNGYGAVQLLQSADRQMKKLLNWVFGGDNDFNALLGGVNLLAMGKNGHRLVTNLFGALEPVLMMGAQSQVDQAVAAAKHRRTTQ